MALFQLKLLSLPFGIIVFLNFCFTIFLLSFNVHAHIYTYKCFIQNFFYFEIYKIYIKLFQRYVCEIYL